MNYPLLASAAVRLFDRIPSVVWAAWILAVFVATGIMALHGGAVG
jgi:hypothetical protein